MVVAAEKPDAQALPPKRNVPVVVAILLVAAAWTLVAAFVGAPSGPLAGWFQWLSITAIWTVGFIYAGPRWYVRSMDAFSEVLGKISQYLVVLVVVVGFLNVVLRFYGRFSEQRLVSNRWIEAQWYPMGGA